MAKKSKGKKSGDKNHKSSRKIEKETRRLIESISDLLKCRDNSYKFKGAKKKTIREMKKNCPHWIIHDRECIPAVEELHSAPGYWTCNICGKQFPIAPFTADQYQQACDSYLGIVNQLFFMSVKMGGDSSDTKVFLKLKDLVPRLNKIAKNEIKQMNKREEFEKRRREEHSSDFEAYTSYGYR